MPIKALTPDADSIQQAFRSLDQVAMPVGERIVGQTLLALEEVMSEYAAQPDRDRANPNGKYPSPYNTYVRGIGQFPRSSFSGGLRKRKGAYKPGPRGGKVRMTSEQMDKKWKMRVQRMENAVVGELRNSASYSGLVLGHKPGTGLEPTQVSFHAESGWPNIEDGLQQIAPKMDEFADRGIKEILSHLAR